MKRILIEPGRAVVSTAGRDEGRRFVVLGVENEFFRLADGDLRRVESPKKKKIRHIRPLPEFFPSIAAILSSGKLPTNADIRRILRETQTQTDRPPRED